MAAASKDEPTKELSHTPVGYEERVEIHTMKARVDALESRLRDLDEVFRRLVGQG